jgi:hypothetical protein
LQLPVGAIGTTGVKDKTAPDSSGVRARQNANETTLEREHDDRNHP